MFDDSIHERVEGGYQLKPVMPAIRKITKGAFRRRLTFDEKVAIKESADPAVKVLEEDLLASSFVDLDFQPLSSGLDYLIGVGILAPERKAQLLQDGTPDEQ
ncbi:hypothetical protein MHM93_07845 [Pseudoalteromonas sp. MM17-2]|uniref:hypothetical protein n=1 Tax=Pseudoalteromonas sp. MM17-2 TaxID=2917753 RepID=UPI001EF6AB46|nr:hypothetical protein [Pseudoalteromonas sp. MM17-2]MCG7544092.1 hypothetical protein [Pseudoalteromonas sp. MM17-2]